MKVYKNLSQLVTLKGSKAKDGRNLKPDDLGIIENGAIVFNDASILWVGKSSELPSEYAANAISLEGHTLTPEIVDSHTHLVFGGNRSQEYKQRLDGVSYEAIASNGGGILFTMKETNKLSVDDLFELGNKRILAIANYGVGTIEIKSGYGLNLEKERELSHCIARLKKFFYPKIQIVNTYLAAHDIPRHYKTSHEYLDQVVIPLLDEFAPMGIIDFVDIFHEKNYFNDEDVEKLFKRASELKIGKRIHADELNDNNGAQLAIKFNAHSADHLLKISDQGIKQLANSKTVATLLPGTAFFLGKPLAPARKLLDAGVKVALASDYNPGSCHCDNLIMIASISAAQLKMNSAEIWTAITLNGAHSLGLHDQGALEVGFKPRFSLFKASSISEITYNWGKNLSVSLP